MSFTNPFPQDNDDDIGQSIFSMSFLFNIMLSCIIIYYCINTMTLEQRMCVFSD